MTNWGLAPHSISKTRARSRRRAPGTIVPYPDLRPAGLRRPPETAPAVADLDLTAGLALLGCEPVRALAVEPPEDRAALGVTDKPAVARLRS